MRTSLLALALAPFAVLALGCVADAGALPEVEADEEAVASVGEELSTTREAFVVLRHDARRCVSPLCGGYYVREVNVSKPKETYVSGLDLAQAGLADEDAAKVTSAPAEELLLKGTLGPIEKRFGTRPFVVTEAYRGLPGVVPASADLFYQARDREPAIQCFAAPCNNELAQKLGAKTTTAFTTLSVARASRPLVDQAWLARQVTSYGGVVAAKLRNGTKYPAGYEKVLDASQVYLRVPVATPPCTRFPLHLCPEGQINTFARTADRCLIPNGCRTPGACSKQHVPVCADGYSMVEWTSAPSACQAYACDPAFVNE